MMDILKRLGRVGEQRSAPEGVAVPAPIEGFPPQADHPIHGKSWISYEERVVPQPTFPKDKSWWARFRSRGESMPEGAPSITAGTGEPERVPLSLRQSVWLVLEHSPDIEVRRMEWEVQEWNISREKAVFEPALVASVKREGNERENTVEETLSQFSTTFKERNNRLSTAVEGVVPTGASYRAGYTLDRLINSLRRNLLDDPFDSEFVTFLGVSLEQPLLRNAWFKATLAPIRIAKAESRASYQTFRREMMAVLARMESLYWDLAFTQRQVELRRASVEVAERLLEDNRERIRAGKMSELEVLEAQSGLAERQELLSGAEQQWVDVMNQLRTVFIGSAAQEHVVFVATDYPGDEDAAQDYARSMELAYQQNPDYLKAREDVEKERLRLAFAKNQRLPELDVVATAGLNGLGGDSDASWVDIRNADYGSWSIGLQLRVPLGGGQQARSEARMARLRKQQALLNLKKAEVEIANTMDTIIRSIEGTRKRFQTARVKADFNQKLLEVELLNLDAGKSDSRRILETEEALFKARIQELENLIQHRKILILRDVTQGTFLDDRGIRIRSHETNS